MWIISWLIIYIDQMNTALDLKNSHKTWQFTKTNTVQWLQGETVVRVEKLALFSRGARRSNSTSRPLHKFLPTELRKQFDPQLKRNQLFRLLFWNSNRFEFVVSFKKNSPKGSEWIVNSEPYWPHCCGGWQSRTIWDICWKIKWQWRWDPAPLPLPNLDCCGGKFI